MIRSIPILILWLWSGSLQARTVSFTVDNPQGNIHEELERHLDSIRACYREELRRDPTSEGSVDTTIELQGGRVQMAATNGTMSHELETCMDDRIRVWTFRGISGFYLLRVQYDFDAGNETDTSTSERRSFGAAVISTQNEPNDTGPEVTVTNEDAYGIVETQDPWVDEESSTSSRSGRHRYSSTSNHQTGTPAPSPEIVHIQVRNNQAVQQCIPWYEERDDEIVDEPLTLRIVLQPTGTASTVTLSNSSFAGTALEACMSIRVKQIEFPAFDGDSEVYRVVIDPN